MSENGIQPEMNEKEKKGSSAVDTARSATKKIKDFASKMNKSKAGTRTLVKALSKALVAGGWVVLIIILVIGIIMFFLTMPGLVMEKLKGLFKALGNAVASFFGENSAEQFDNVEIYKVLNYLDDMGYDLKGYGFITEFLVDTDDYDDGGAGENLQTNELKITGDGVIRAIEDNRVVTGQSDFINAYLVSENYIYTIKNFNVDTEDTVWGKIKATWRHIQSVFVDTLTDRTGMLVIYHDSGTVGVRDGLYKAAERGYIKFEGKNLLIKKGWTNGAMQYSLEGWTGRYGMPVDFLLTVHMATMMPDLAYDMTQSFKTEVNLLLHATSRNSFWML